MTVHWYNSIQILKILKEFCYFSKIVYFIYYIYMHYSNALFLNNEFNLDPISYFWPFLFVDVKKKKRARSYKFLVEFITHICPKIQNLLFCNRVSSINPLLLLLFATIECWLAISFSQYFFSAFTLNNGPGIWDQSKPSQSCHLTERKRCPVINPP